MERARLTREKSRCLLFAKHSRLFEQEYRSTPLKQVKLLGEAKAMESGWTVLIGLQHLPNTPVDGAPSPIPCSGSFLKKRVFCPTISGPNLMPIVFSTLWTIWQSI